MPPAACFSNRPSIVLFSARDFRRDNVVITTAWAKCLPRNGVRPAQPCAAPPNFEPAWKA
jgi:hypothetical protein